MHLYGRTQSHVDFHFLLLAFPICEVLGQTKAGCFHVGPGKGLNWKLERERRWSVIMVGKCVKQRAFNAEMFVFAMRVNAKHWRIAKDLPLLSLCYRSRRKRERKKGGWCGWQVVLDGRGGVIEGIFAALWFFFGLVCGFVYNSRDVFFIDLLFLSLGSRLCVPGLKFLNSILFSWILSKESNGAVFWVYLRSFPHKNPIFGYKIWILGLLPLVEDIL